MQLRSRAYFLRHHRRRCRSDRSPAAVAELPGARRSGRRVARHGECTAPHPWLLARPEGPGVRSNPGGRRRPGNPADRPNRSNLWAPGAPWKRLGNPGILWHPVAPARLDRPEGPALPAPLLCHSSPERRAPWAAPVAPWAPVEPWNPCGPAMPCGPCAPAAPWAPVAPLAPVVPWEPWLPWDPVAPVHPGSPGSPDGPGYPGFRWHRSLRWCPGSLGCPGTR